MISDLLVCVEYGGLGVVLNSLFGVDHRESLGISHIY